MNFLVADLTRKIGRDCEQQTGVFRYRISRREKGDSRLFDKILRISWFPGASHESNHMINKIGKSE